MHLFFLLGFFILRQFTENSEKPPQFCDHIVKTRVVPDLKYGLRIRTGSGFGLSTGFRISGRISGTHRIPDIRPDIWPDIDNVDKELRISIFNLPLIHWRPSKKLFLPRRSKMRNITYRVSRKKTIHFYTHKLERFWGSAYFKQNLQLCFLLHK